MQRWILVGIGVVVVAVVIALVAANGGDSVPETTLAAADTTTSTEAVETTQSNPGTSGAPQTTAAAATETTYAACEQVPADYVVGEGWFSNFTDHQVPDGGEIVDNTLYAWNVVQLQFPVDGGPMYLYGSAFLTRENGDIETYGFVRDSRREPAPAGGTALVYDPATQAISGEVPVSASITATSGTGPQKTDEQGTVAAQYDAASGAVTGTVTYSQLTLELQVATTPQVLDVFTTPDCWDTLVEQP
jgi:hypothetical protein